MKLNPLRLNSTDLHFERDFQARLHWSSEADEAIELRVQGILARVKKEGDGALLAYTRELDGMDVMHMDDLSLGQSDFEAAFQTPWFWRRPMGLGSTVPSPLGARKRWQLWPMEQQLCPKSTKSLGPATPMWPVPSGGCLAPWALT